MGMIFLNSGSFFPNHLARFGLEKRRELASVISRCERDSAVSFDLPLGPSQLVESALTQTLSGGIVITIGFGNQAGLL